MPCLVYVGTTKRIISENFGHRQHVDDVHNLIFPFSSNPVDE